jgi:4-hydroxybenzoate polyprenyltransferase
VNSSEREVVYENVMSGTGCWNGVGLMGFVGVFGGYTSFCSWNGLVDVDVDVDVEAMGCSLVGKSRSLRRSLLRLLSSTVVGPSSALSRCAILLFEDISMGGAIGPKQD